MVGSNQLELNVEEGMTVEQLKGQLKKLYPEFKKLKNFAIAVNSTYVGEDRELHTGDEIAVIPPVSGG